MIEQNMFEKRILILAPHPVDELVGCATAIHRAVQDRCHVFILFLTHGMSEVNRQTYQDQKNFRQNLRLRQRIIGRIADELCVEVLNNGDLHSHQLIDNIRRPWQVINDAIEQTRPHVIWAPAYEGGHPDHDITNYLASTFRSSADVWEFSEYHFAGNEQHTNSFISDEGTQVFIELKPDEKKRKQELLTLYDFGHRHLLEFPCVQEVFRLLPDYDYSEPPFPNRPIYQEFNQSLCQHLESCNPQQVSRAIMTYHEHSVAA